MRDRSCRALTAASLAVITSAFLISCNSSSSEDSRIPALAASATDESAAGIFFGTISADGPPPVTNRAFGVVSEDFDVQFPVLLSSQLHYAGQVFVSGTVLSGTLTEYRGAFRRFSGVDGVSSVDINGEVLTADNLSASYSGATGSGQIELDYNTLYETGSSLDSTTGIWSFGEAFLGGGAYAVTLDIDATGGLFGNDSDGCVFSGRIRIIDGRYNAYGASVAVDNCGNFDGNYDGLAFLSDRDSGRLNVLTISVSNDVFAFVSVFDKT